MKHAISVLARALVVSMAAVAPAAAYIDPGTGSMLLQMLGAGIAGAIFYFREIADEGPFDVHATRGACGRGRIRAAARRHAPLIRGRSRVPVPFAIPTPRSSSMTAD